jgi:3-oxoacyl-[acyl-carrier protein] reductase
MLRPGDASGGHARSLTAGRGFRASIRTVTLADRWARMAMENSSSLAGRVAVVTGASSGIGAASARLFAAAGARVVVGYNKGAERAAAVVAELAGSGHAALPLPLEDSAQIAKAAAAVKDGFGRADILVNSAGFTRMVPHHDLDALDDDLIDQVLTANVRGPFATIRAFVPLLRASGDGVIVNISSGAAVSGTGSSIIYGASKAALNTMSLSLARVLGPEIRVVVVAPGMVHTGFVPGRTEEMMHKAAMATPLKRAIEAADVAQAVIACVTHLTHTTGSIVTVDAGRHL